MATLKYSRQRESIKNYLASTTEHPTADTVYMHVKEEFPNISLGTVYRNLNLLTDLGEAVKITTPDGGDRFDGDVRPTTFSALAAKGFWISTWICKMSQS